MWISILAHLILIAGTATLIGLVVKFVLLTLNKVLSKVREKLAARAGRRVFMTRVAKLAKEVTAEAERTGNVHKVDDLMRELGNDGIVCAAIDEDGEVEESEIEIWSAESVDEPLNNMFRKNNDEIVLA